MARIAVIDLGSNSVRMTITKLSEDGSHRLIESARAMVRLSEGMGREGVLQPEPMARTLQALSLFQRLMQVHQVSEVYPVATAAVRQAVNAAAFLEAVRDRTGIVFEVITGEEEAQLDFLGVANTISLTDFAMIDIGGASTEIAVIRNREAIGKTSLPWGAVNLTEQFGLSGKPSRKKREAAHTEISRLLQKCQWLPKDPGLPLVGLGGTVRALLRRLGACLMLAEQLDRAEGGAIAAVSVSLSTTTVRVLAQASEPQADVTLELAAAARCAPHVEKEFGRQLKVDCAAPGDAVRQ